MSQPSPVNSSAAAAPNGSTVIHLVRHGEVENPGKVLYGRLPGFRLSAVGEQMAQRLAEYFAGAGVGRVVASPLERAQQTAAPLANSLGLDVVTDGRLIEAANVFEGKQVTGPHSVLRRPSAWLHLYNPIRPSWGEPYTLIAQRMAAAISSARQANPGGVSVLVSHQLPVWIARLDAEHRRLWHDPRTRQCTLASVTTLQFRGERLAMIGYDEPCADLLPLTSSVPGA